VSLDEMNVRRQSIQLTGMHVMPIRADTMDKGVVAGEDLHDARQDRLKNVSRMSKTKQIGSHLLNIVEALAIGEVNGCDLIKVLE
jgi:hypothetical protein